MKIKYKINTLEDEVKLVEQLSSFEDFFKEEGIVCFYPEEGWKKNWNESDYDKHKELIEAFKERQEYVAKRLKDIFKGEIETIKVFFSLYGTAGSYNLPNEVYINVNKKNTEWADVETLEHEIIHLFVECYVQDNNLSHNAKENVVNFIQSIL